MLQVCYNGNYADHYACWNDVIPSTPTMPPGGVPRFASFQPEHKPATTERESPYPRTEQEYRNEIQNYPSSRLDRKNRSSHREHKDHTRSRRRHRDDYSGTRHAIDRNKSPRNVPIHENQSVQSDSLFVIDRFGDLEAARYGASKHDVPKYEQTDHRSALGKHSMSKSGKKPRNNDPIKAGMVPETPSTDSEQNFVYLEQPKEESYHPVYRDPYRSLQNMPQKQQDISLFAQSSAQEQIREIHGHLSRDPSNLSLWFKLAQLQALLIEPDHDAIFSNKNETNLAKMQLAVLERAESSTTKNHKALPLELARLLITAKTGIWSSEKLERRWRTILEEYPSRNTACLPEYGQIWWLYIQFRKSDWASFALDDMLGVFEEALNTITQNSQLPGSQQLVHAWKTTILKELCFTLRSAGYPERAFGILQAVLEFHLGMLEDSGKSNFLQDHLVEIFGAWWDAEHARIGDDLPYSGFHINTQDINFQQSPMYLQQDESPIKLDNYDDEVFENHGMVNWQRTELRVVKDSTPHYLHSDSPKASADPFSYVFFNDIRSTLFEPANDGVASVLRVADVFLEYIGLPSHWYSSTLLFGSQHVSMTEELRIHPTIWPSYGSLQIIRAFWQPYQAMQSSISGEQVLQNVPVTPDTLFPYTPDNPCGEWFSCLPAVPSNVAKTAERVLVHLGGRLATLSQSVLVTMTSLPHAILCAAFEKPKIARNVLRAALQQYDHCLLLWYAYAQFEISSNRNIDVVRKVLVQVLGSLGRASDNTNKFGTSLLWALWAELEWSTGETETCLRVLSVAASTQMDFANGVQSLQSQIYSGLEVPLRSTEKLQLLHNLRRLNQSANENTGSAPVFLPSAAFCLALAEFLLQDVQVGDELKSAVLVFQSALKSGDQELQQQTASKFQRFLFLVRHICPRTSYRPRELRAISTQLFELDPHNSCHLQMLVNQENHAHLENYVRECLRFRSLHNGTRGSWLELINLMPDNVAEMWANAEQAWLMAVKVEVNLLKHLEATRIRNILDSAVHCISSSSLLWHLAIGFEIHLLSSCSERQHRRKRMEALKRAKALLYQAIRHCPFDKGTSLHSFSIVSSCI